MKLYPAIDLYGGQAVRLYKGDYDKMTVYSPDPLAVARKFRDAGAQAIHLVDLEGAKTGQTPHLDLICRIRRETGLFCQVGGGIRSPQVLETYLSAGLDRAILGTAAVENPAFAAEAVARWGDKIAVGVDIKDGKAAVRGWTQGSLDAMELCRTMEGLGVRTLICTDISRDGAMQGANRELYARLQAAFSMDIIASGGVSSLEDIRALAALGIHGAILGKAYYTGAVALEEALEAAK